MADFHKNITEIAFQNSDYHNYQQHFVGCLIVTQNGQLLLQKRGDNWDRFPGVLATFGGQLDAGETADQGLIRELYEELGAEVILTDSIYLGAFTKTDLENALIHGYFWHDKTGSITGCYEGESAFFNSTNEILQQPNITPDVFWLISKCLNRQLLNNVLTP